MRSDKTFIKLLRKLADLLASEAAANPTFADKLEALLGAPIKKPTVRQPTLKLNTELTLPDIHAEWNAKGEREFLLWLRDQPVATLRALISRHDLDATRRTSKWKDAEKLSAYIADQLKSRSARGASFLRGGSSTD